MTSAASAIAVTRALDAVMREDRGRLISALISRLKNFELAEESLQEAMASALSHWGRTGLPHSPQAWLLQVAWRKALDRIRRTKLEINKNEQTMVFSGTEYGDEPDEIVDHRLRLIFTCCHPALELKSRIALTLRTICGLSTPEVAAAFLDQETTMGQRLTRAKAKIAAAGIPYAVPGAEAWLERLQGVLAVIYLIFNAGYSAAPDTTRDLAGEAIFLAQLLDQLCPDQPEVEGCLALLLLTHSRRAARVSVDGVAIPLRDQDQGLWDTSAIAKGLALIDCAMHRRAPGPYQIKAAIAACHMANDEPDFAQIVALYDSLLQFEPTPVVQLNRAVAIADAGAHHVGVQLLEAIAPDLVDYQPFHAAYADLLVRVGRKQEARMAFDLAIRLATAQPDVLLLERKRAQV